MKAYPPTCVAILALTATLVGCAAPPQSVTGRSDAELRPTTRVVIANGIDGSSLASKLDGGGAFAKSYHAISNSPLVVLDPKTTEPVPFLIAELPSQDAGTWTVAANGTMTTTYKIQPRALWHDGQPIVSSDFVFVLQVYMDPEIPISSRHPERLMERIEVLEEKTFKVHWKEIYPWANRFQWGEFEPLPAHALATLYRDGDKAAFLNEPFFTTPAYIGSGPYVLTEWERGVQLVYRAFDQFFKGRPQIDEVAVKVITDVNTVVANLLSGAADATAGPGSVNSQSRMALKQIWDTTGEGRVIDSPVTFRHFRFQLEPSRVGQPALLDVRVRRAIAHTLDRVAIADAISSATLATEVPILKSHPLHERVDRAIAKYPYDPSRALGLLQEAGWVKRGDALVSSASGERFRIDIGGTVISEQVTERSFAAANLRELGIEMTESPRPQQVRDRESIVGFLGMENTVGGTDVPRNLVFTSSECPTAENRLTGGNQGCWRSAEYDRFAQIANSALNDRERADAFVQAMRVQTEDVGILGLSHGVNYIAATKGLLGPEVAIPTQTQSTWNIWEWRWE